MLAESRGDDGACQNSQDGPNHPLIGRKGQAAHSVVPTGCLSQKPNATQNRAPSQDNLGQRQGAVIPKVSPGSGEPAQRKGEQWQGKDERQSQFPPLAIPHASNLYRLQFADERIYQTRQGTKQKNEPQHQRAEARSLVFGG